TNPERLALIHRHQHTTAFRPWCRNSVLVIVHVAKWKTPKASGQRINLSVVWNAQRPLKLDLESSDGSVASISDPHGFRPECGCYFLRSSIDNLALGFPAC